MLRVVSQISSQPDVPRARACVYGNPACSPIDRPWAIVSFLDRLDHSVSLLSLCPHTLCLQSRVSKPTDIVVLDADAITRWSAPSAKG